MTQSLSHRPAAQARPPTHKWITEFLYAGGDHWDREAAIALTSQALFSVLAHADRPVRLATHRDGKAAWVSVSAPTSTVPKTEWTAGSPLVEDLLPRLRQRTRHCGAEARITHDGTQTMVWFMLPRETHPHPAGIAGEIGRWTVGWPPAAGPGRGGTG